MKFLFIGDVFGRPGRQALRKFLPEIRSKQSLDFVIANVENAAGGRGLTPALAEEFFQMGVDVPITKNISFNVDVKQLSLSTDVYLNGSRLGTYHIDPTLFGVGVGYRF